MLKLRLFTVLIMTFTAGCNGLPLAVPEEKEAPKQAETVVAEAQPVAATATQEIIGGSTSSPLPTPTTMPIPATQTPIRVPTPTPGGPTPPPINTPTQAPSPTPTPTFEPLSDKPIMGFVFKPPQEIPSTRKIPGVEIVGWLPGSSEEILLRGIYDLGTVNLSTEEVKLYATVKEAGNINPQPIWSSEAQGVAYLSWDLQTSKQNLWLGKAGSETDLLLADVYPPLIPLKQGQGVAVYSQDDQTMRGISFDGREISLPPPFTQLPVSESGPPGSSHRVAVQPKGDWLAYYNTNDFQFFNPETGERRPLDLGNNELGPFWASNARWSPDGQKLALILTQGNVPILFSDLYILDWPTMTLQKVNDTFQFIKDVAWAPDGQHLLLQPVIGEKDGFSVLALYITNVLKTSDILPVPIPIEGLSSGVIDGGLSWSPDGRKVLVHYSDNTGSALYGIEVTTQ